MSEVVEVERHGNTQPALVAERYQVRAGGHAQERVTVVCKDEDQDRLVEYDTAADRVDHVDGVEADVARDILGEKVGVIADAE